jgi:hypothetical protein
MSVSVSHDTVNCHMCDVSSEFVVVLCCHGTDNEDCGFVGYDNA